MTGRDNLVAHLERVIEAGSIEELWSLHLAKMNEYGFSRLLYGFTRFRTSNSFGSAEDVLVLSNHPEDYLAAFVQSRTLHAGAHGQVGRRERGRLFVAADRRTGPGPGDDSGRTEDRRA